jgi:ParB family chromosome partitioning protein
VAERPQTGAPLRRGGLGRGLESLIPTAQPREPRDEVGAGVAEAPIEAIEPNPYQPRASIDSEQLELLAESIRTHGVIQPLIVRTGDAPGRYVLIAGERRWRAARLAGLTQVPVVIKDAADQTMLELALVENVVLVGIAGATLGHRLLGMRVEALDGSAPGPVRALLRSVLLSLAIPPLVWDADHRGLRDRWAGTLVART